MTETVFYTILMVVFAIFHTALTIYILKKMQPEALRAFKTGFYVILGSTWFGAIVAVAALVQELTYGH